MADGSSAVALHVATLRMRSPRFRVALALAVCGGGGAIALQRLGKQMRAFRREQRSLTDKAIPVNADKAGDADGRDTAGSGDRSRGGRVAVDARFAKRLSAILRICVPGPMSSEAGLIAFQGVLLLARTLLSDTIARLEGICGEKVTGQDWLGFRKVVFSFAAVAVPASIVNASLKAVQILIQLAFRKRLTAYLHKSYLGNRAYYAASVLGGLSHADQRITDDVEKFCESVAELYSNTFKPLLDMLLFTRSLIPLIGLRGQLFLHGYFIVIGALLRAQSPPLGLMTAQYSTLNGAFRTAHSRIASSAEEIAFNDPPSGRAEMLALNKRLECMVRHSRLTAYQRCLQSCIDGYFTKYTASVIGLVIFALPLYNTPKDKRGTSTEIAGRYINAMRLMMQASSAMGQLVLMYKRVNTLAGHTARVSELLEEVRELGKPNGQQEAFRRVQNRVRQSAGSVVPTADTAMANGHADGGKSRASGSFADLTGLESARPAKSLNGSSIKLDEVSVWSPDGTLLVKDLTMSVPPGTSLIIEGPNGSGKSSILRMLAGLWPLQSGTVTLPPRSSIFFLSQRPYMFAGGSLADQLMYPNLPGVVVGEKVIFDEERATRCLRDVELSQLVSRCDGFGGSLAWDDVLSGGERNRLAVARLLYHRPAFAILDEVSVHVLHVARHAQTLASGCGPVKLTCDVRLACVSNDWRVVPSMQRSAQRR